MAAFEISIGGAGADFVAGKLIRIHRKTHAAAGFAPLKTGFIENLVEAFVDGLPGDFL